MYRIYKQSMVLVSDDVVTGVLEYCMVYSNSLSVGKMVSDVEFLINRLEYYEGMLEPHMVPITDWYKIDV